MHKVEAIKQLHQWDKKQAHVFTKRNLRKIFWQDNEKTFTEGLHRLVKAELLKRVCRKIYLNPHANSIDSYTLERVAIALRPSEYNYLSLESVLSEYGLISQIPVDRLTIMTTGRKGVYQTSLGTIEFTHTKRSAVDILENTLVSQSHPLRVAKPLIAWRDLKRVGRNTHLVNTESFYD